MKMDDDHLSDRLKWDYFAVCVHIKTHPWCICVCARAYNRAVGVYQRVGTCAQVLRVVSLLGIKVVCVCVCVCVCVGRHWEW
jgi:hypothetical protein